MQKQLIDIEKVWKATNDKVKLRIIPTCLLPNLNGDHYSNCKLNIRLSYNLSS